MKKKWISAISISYLVCFGFACQTIKFVHLTPGVEKHGTGNKLIYAVVTLDDNRIEFEKNHPAGVKEGNVVGVAVDEKGHGREVKIPLSQVKMIWYKSLSMLKTVKNLIINAGLAIAGIGILSGITRKISEQ